MLSCLAVGAGGFLGAVLRYLIGTVPFPQSSFPTLTLLINIVGSFAIGLLVGLAVKSSPMSGNMMLFLKVGLCGGFTTFSAFALETQKLISDGKFFIGIAYMLLSVLLCVAAAFIGQILIRTFVR